MFNDAQDWLRGTVNEDESKVLNSLKRYETIWEKEKNEL